MRTIEIALALVLLSGCADPDPDQPEDARIDMVAAIDPELTDPINPVPARLLWVSTRAGTARILSLGRELIDRVGVSGGELVSTPIPADRLEPGNNPIEIRLASQNLGGPELVAEAQLFVDAECTWHDHCPDGPCENFICP